MIKLTQRGVNRYGLFAIVAMLFMIVVIWFRQVPPSWHGPMLGIAIALFLFRITLRLMLARQEREKRNAAQPPVQGPTA